MNYYRWLTPLINTRKPMQKFRLFRGRRKNWGTMSVSLISVGVATVLYILRRGANNQWSKPIQNLVNNVQNTMQNANVRTGLAEFANEITPDNNTMKNKANKTNPNT